MPDKFSKDKRSEIMSHIRSKNTKPELLVFGYLKSHGVYFQRHYRSKEKINIDVALPRKKKAVFIDGDFWHGNTFEKRKDTLSGFWAAKIIRNIKRDKAYREELRRSGWEILRVWESDLMRSAGREETLARIKKFLG